MKTEFFEKEAEKYLKYRKHIQKNGYFAKPFKLIEDEDQNNF